MQFVYVNCVMKQMIERQNKLLPYYCCAIVGLMNVILLLGTVAYNRGSIR
jgi:hypothetical protein